MLAVMAVHIGAAWKHHFILDDGVLAHMLPHIEKKDWSAHTLQGVSLGSQRGTLAL